MESKPSGSRRLLFLGIVVMIVGFVLIVGATQFLPDIRPVATSALIALSGAGLILYSRRKGARLKVDKTQIILFTEGALLALIALLLAPKIQIERPGDPFGVLVLSLISSALIFYTANRKSHDADVMSIVGLIFLANFIIIPIWESGALNSIGEFYRIFVPIYASLDAYADMPEYLLIAVTLILTVLFIVRKVRVSDYGKWTLSYFVLQPIMAIFLFEMFGNPAGWLAGTTTRSDLLSTNINAVGSTFGMVFIACVAYILLYKYSFTYALAFSGTWWIVWKSFMLHHPPPNLLLASGEGFVKTAGFLFLTGTKRMLLPMIIIVLVINFVRKRRLLP